MTKSRNSTVLPREKRNVQLMQLKVRAGKLKRSSCVGANPKRNSAIFRQIYATAESKGRLLRDNGVPRSFQDPDDHKWYPIEKADLCHKKDCVLWWNETGRFWILKNLSMFEWLLQKQMDDPENYYLGHQKRNRSLGARLRAKGVKYLPPPTS